MSKKTKPKKRWWISRDGVRPGVDIYNIHFTYTKPELVGRCFTAYIISLDGRRFRELFSLQLRKGQCKEIERPQLVLKKKGLRTFTVNLTRAEFVVLQDGDQGAADVVIDQILEQAK